MDDESWLMSAYCIMKRFLGIARREYQLLSLGQYSDLLWSTNDVDSIRPSPLRMMKSHPDNFNATVKDCVPGLNALLMYAVMMPQERGNPLAVSLLGVTASLRDLGVDMDPLTNVMATWFSLTPIEPTLDAHGEKKVT